MTKKMTCIVCPIGCSLVLQLENKKIVGVSGNTCVRGEKYAITECTNPQRVVTTTVRCINGKVLSVKTNKGIPKDKVFECMKIINGFTCPLQVKVGDVIISNVFGADIVATKNME